MTKNELRKELRHQRRKLSPQALQTAEVALARQARRCYRLMSTQRLVSYAPFAGEIAPTLLVKQLAASTVFFPRITNFRRSLMQFYPSHRVDTLNKYGISEPRAIGSPWPANAFNTILVPLVAFDRTGTRVGMGAGYYDRALAALQHQTGTRPFLIGLAHSFQEVDSLERAPWDVPLDAILTDQEFISI